ncbi:MAG TPA: hypothetical protein VLA17_04625 [Candidatus Limnocylindria bacterium]|nr:hypothetical protein [Candidatus Limnocylindria bacterium]
MSEAAHLLMIEFLDWISSRRRTYSETMEAWQSHCPRMTIWEDALMEQLIQVDKSDTNRDPPVMLTARGMALLTGNGKHR